MKDVAISDVSADELDDYEQAANERPEAVDERDSRPENVGHRPHDEVGYSSLTRSNVRHNLKLTISNVDGMVTWKRATFNKDGMRGERMETKEKEYC